MKRTLTNLKNLPKLQLPSQVPKAVTLPQIEAVPQLPRLATRTAAAYAAERDQRVALEQAALKEKSYKSLTGVKDANDPYVLNSTVDALFNRKAKEKRYGKFSKVLHKIPVLGDVITGAVALVDTSLVSPTADLLKGDFQALGINTLTNFSETMDILANPVKSLIAPLVAKDKDDPKYKMPWYERLGSSIGFTDAGRYNYDYDTGFWLSDLGLEMISDPTTIISLIASGGTSGAAKAAGSGAMSITKTATKEAFEATTKAGIELVTKAGKEVTEEAFQKIVTKKYTSKLIKKTLELRKLGNSISAAGKKVVKETGDDALKVLLQNLDTALANSKGIVDDTVKGTIKSITTALEAVAKTDLDDAGTKAVTKLIKLTDEFNSTASFTLKNYLEGIIGETSNNTNKILTKEAAKKNAKLSKALKELNKSAAPDSEKLKEITDGLKVLFSDPANIKKYRNLFNVENFDDLVEALNKVDFTDYLNSTNALLQHSRAFKFASALDALAEGTQAVDNAILRASIYSSAPVVPFVTNILRPTAGAIIKTFKKSSFGKRTIDFLTKRLESVDNFFRSKFHSAKVLAYDDLRLCYTKVFAEFDIFSGSKLSTSGFEKELAQSIYNDTFNWLRGYGDPNAYTFKLEDQEKINAGLLNSEAAKSTPINILNATAEEQKNQIWNAYRTQFEELGVPEEQAVDYFFKEVDRMGQLGFGFEPLQDWTISEYVAQLRITDALIVARSAYKDFDEVLKAGTLEKKSNGAVLAYSKDFDTSAVTSVKGPLTKAVEILDSLGTEFHRFDDLQKVKEQVIKIFPYKVFYSRKKGIRELISNSLMSFSDAANKTVNAYNTLDMYKKLGVAKDLLQKQEDICFDAVTRMHNAASNLRANLLDFSKSESFKDTKLAPLYDHLQQIASPYYGQKYRTQYELNQFLEIASNPRLKTIEVLQDKDFQSLITSLKPGGEGFNMLEQVRVMVESELKSLDKKDKANLLKIKTEEDYLKSIDFIKSTINNIDSYVEHMALVKQSTLPEFMQEIYLDVLSELPIRSAAHFMQNFDANASEVIRRMNEKLTNRVALHTYDQDYIAAELYNTDGFKAVAQRYRASNRTAADEVGLIEAAYRAKILPEFSKKTTDDLGKETSQYVHREYGAYKNKQEVFIGFKSSGENPNLNDITDISFKAGKTSWSFDPAKDEISNLLDFQAQIKSITEKGDAVFITYNGNHQDIDFLRTRLYELMEETYIEGLGDPELYKAYQMAKRHKASPEELAEIFEQMRQSMNAEVQSTFHKLSEAQLWLERNMYYTSLNCVDLLKQFDGIPTVGKYYHDIKDRFLMSYMHRQASYGGNINVTIDNSFLDNLQALPTFEADKLGVSVKALDALFSKLQNYDSTLFSRGGAYAANGRMLIDGNYYRKGIRRSSVTQTLNAHQVQVQDTSELLRLNEEGRWVYHNTVLPKELVTSNEAVKYLKENGVIYAPKWKALNPDQQLSTYPVMINGKVTLQQIEGTLPVVVKNYIDIPLAKQFFDLENTAKNASLWASYKKQHHFTMIAEQMSDILAQITNPGAIDEIAPIIEELWKKVTKHIKDYKEGWSPYALLKSDLNTYQKYAALSVMLKDNTAGTPNRLIKEELKKKAETIHLPTFIKENGLEPPVRPKDFSKKSNGYRRLTYTKLEDLPGYQSFEKPKLLQYSKRYAINQKTLYADVYFKTLSEVQKDPTVPYRDALKAAYEAYKEAVNSQNNFIKAIHNDKIKAVYDKNNALWEAHKAEIDRINEEIQEELHQQYLKEMDAYNLWWDEIKETVKILEQAEAEKPEIIAENALRTKASKMLYNPEYHLSKKSSFRRLYEENHHNSNLGYTDSVFSRTSYIDHLYTAEARSTIDKSRELFEALEEVNQDVLNSTKAFKVALERPKNSGQFRSVYAPGMQRHATLGMSLINLNNKIVEVANRFKDGPAFDTFLACDKQVVNNLEDLILQQVLQLTPEGLTSFVLHQGRGVVVIPVGKYLTDTAHHNIDIRWNIENFLKRYNNYDSPVLGVKRSGDNLVLYIKDYKFHVKQNAIPKQTLNPLDFDKAFKSAYGYPVNAFDPSEFKLEQAKLGINYDPNSLEYQEKLSALHKKYAKKFGITTKQSAFLSQYYDDIEELRKAYQAHYSSLSKLSLDYEAQYSFKQGGYGRTIDFKTYKSIFDQLPTSIRKEIGVLDDLELEKVFNTANGDIFNFSTLGRAAYRLDIEPYASSNYQSIMANTYRTMAYNLSAVTQYAQFYFEESPWTLKNFFQYAQSDAEILTALKSTDAYTVSTLQVNSKGLPIVKELKINTLEDLRAAVNANAILTPTTTFGSISQTLNNYRWNNSKFKWMHKLSYITKMAMLILNPGFIFRNIIDSTLKNFLVTKDKNEVLESYLEAIDLHQKYQDTINLLFAVNKEHPFRPDVMDIVLKDSTAPLTEAQFMFIHNFYENGPSAGSINRVSDYYLQQSLKKGSFKQSALQRTIDVLMRPTKDIEDITRFSAYIAATKRGLTNVDAFELIRKTHFDYGTKTNTQYWLELVFPFYSFKLKNFEFWLEFASQNPSVTYKLLQMATSEWNWSEIDFERIEYYQSQLNHMTQANIKLNEQGLTLKINPSMMDPVNILLDPIDSLASSVSPWVQPIMDAIAEKEPYNYDKLVGTAAGSAIATIPGLGLPGMAIAAGSQYASRLTSGIRSAARTGSKLPLVLPSVFGSVKTPEQYGRASYTNSRSFMDAEKRRPRRVNIYNKYYTDTGKNRWKIRFYPIDAATVQYRIKDNYNRFR